MAAKSAIKRVVKTVVPKASDLELHVSVITVPKHGDEEFVDVRDYVPSTKTYGRGVVIPDGALRQVYQALGELF